jgi:hypothetical protein
MSKFDMGWNAINHKVRMRFGLRWQRRYPSMDDFESLANWLLAVALIVMLFAIYGLMDAHDRATTAQIESEQTSSRLAHLLNGGTLTDEAQTVAVRCLNVLDVVN